MSKNGKNGKTVVTVAFSMLPVDVATIDAHGKDTGVIGRSAALRLILNEWRQFKAREAGVGEEG